ncbi:MAG: hypothetical protein H6622_00915 [Halobacteriovoraceae bacterium]|nr:hypothetical protein [Halobacteriovoraceae bacterium]
MDIVYFIIKHTPYWAVPFGMISAEFSYIYWLKSFKKVSVTFFVFGVFCFISLLYYLIGGGPDAAVDNLIWFFHQI